MDTITVYRASDGLWFSDKDRCLVYEEEIDKHPDESGITFYDSYGNEIDIRDIRKVALYKVSNPIIADARLNSLRILKIASRAPFKTEEGCYIIRGVTDHFKIDPELFDDYIKQLQE